MDENRRECGDCNCGAPIASAGKWLAALTVLVGLAVGLLLTLGASAQGHEDTRGAAQTGDSCVIFDQDHAKWTALLQQFVHEGVVDYAGLKARGQGPLQTYLRDLESVCASGYGAWSRSQKLAFWINSYNAYTVRLILDHHPVRSIRQIGVLPFAAFRDSFIALPASGRPTTSLNDIEHDILRGRFREPRIHFAIVCASKSCPALRSEAYRARDLERQLDEAARAFVRDPAKNRYDAATRTLHLSSIFEWFDDDFVRAAGSVPAFVARYGDEATAAAARAAEPRIDYLPYDWSLNGR